MKKRIVRKSHHRFHRKNYSHRKEYTTLCDYCHRDCEGLPHTCKFCGKTHCPKHVVPESHKCQGLKPVRYFGENIRRENYKRPLETQETHTYQPNITRYNPHSHEREHTPNHRGRTNFKMPKIKLPRINKFFVALVVAVISYFLATKFIENNYFLWIEVGACGYLAFLIYKPAFKWANRVSMADDLSFFGLRILGAVVVFVGLYFGFAVLFASIFVRNSAPVIIPIVCLLGGLIILGGFIAFRTNRRHHVVGIWRA